MVVVFSQHSVRDLCGREICNVYKEENFTKSHHLQETSLLRKFVTEILIPAWTMFTGRCFTINCI